MNDIKVKLTREGARLPERKSQTAAGYDIYTPMDIIVRPGRSVIKTGVAIELPPNMEAQVRPRSGLTLKGMQGYSTYYFENEHRYDCDVQLGTIDSDYRDEIGVIVNSHELGSFIIPQGTRIAQLVISIVPETQLVLTDSLSDTQRGIGGFGHTGTR